VPGQNIGKSSNYDEGESKGFSSAKLLATSLVVPWWKDACSPIDFTNPAARKWFNDQLQRLLTQSRSYSERQGACNRRFKTDDGETQTPPTAQRVYTAYGNLRRRPHGDGDAQCVLASNTSAVFRRFGKQRGALRAERFRGLPAFPGHWPGDNEPNFGPNGCPV